jgi:hypothetical protein
MRGGDVGKSMVVPRAGFEPRTIGDITRISSRKLLLFSYLRARVHITTIVACAIFDLSYSSEEKSGAVFES